VVVRGILNGLQWSRPVIGRVTETADWIAGNSLALQWSRPVFGRVTAR
jgi:hypothetical protein